jgi:glycerophosphoryl diester phosphodiesterase
MTETFRIFGHRGSPRRFAENTVESFEEALRCGADGFETDLRLLADGTAVLFHDDELYDRDVESLTTGDFRFYDVRFDPVRELGRFADRATMILEVKRSRWEDILCSEISSWNDIVVASFDHATIAELSKRRVTFPLGVTIAGTLVGLADYVERLGATWVFPNFRYVNAEMVEPLHRRGVKVVPWTPNLAIQWQRLRDAGCDGVITDYPGEAVDWRNTTRASSE